MDVIFSNSSGFIISPTKNNLIQFSPSTGQVTKRFDLPYEATCFCPFQSIILVGCKEGYLLLIDEQGLFRSILLRENLPIRQIAVGDSYIHVLMENVLVAFDDEHFPDDMEGWSCYYELPGQIQNIMTIDDPKVQGWPNIDMSTSNSEIKLLALGTSPMCSIIGLSSLTESLHDPLKQAAGYISNKVTNWFSRSPVRDESLLSKLSMGFTTVLLSINDGDRNLIRSFRWRDKFILFDCYYGRALVLDPISGIFLSQIKGLRNCQILVAEDLLYALHPRRHYIDVISLTDFSLIKKIETPPEGEFHLLFFKDNLVYMIITDNFDNDNLKMIEIDL